MRARRRGTETRQARATCRSGSGDAKRRQAVVNVAERDREITRDLHVSRVDMCSDDLSDAQRSDIIRRFPVFVPNGQLVGYSVLSRRSSWCRIRATLRAPKTSFSLLMGFDEVRQFIAALPGRASTVEEAHRLLRPNVSRRARRQGEWFFGPRQLMNEPASSAPSTVEPWPSCRPSNLVPRTGRRTSGGQRTVCHRQRDRRPRQAPQAARAGRLAQGDPQRRAGGADGRRRQDDVGLFADA